MDIFKGNVHLAHQAANILNFVANLPKGINSTTLGPGLVKTRTPGALYVGSRKDALDERLLSLLRIHMVITAALPYGDWPKEQKTIYSKLGIAHVVVPLLDAPVQVGELSL